MFNRYSNTYSSKCIRCISLAFIGLLMISMTFVGNVYAQSKYEFHDNPYNETVEAELWKNIGLYSKKVQSSERNTIVNMDVSFTGKVAVALDGDSILVFDSNGNFIKQFCFHSYGSYYIKWYEDNLSLFMVREGAVVEFTLDSEKVGVYAVESESPIWDELREQTKIVSDGNVYELKKGTNGVFALFSNYTVLQKTDGFGNETIIYEADTVQNFKPILIIIVFVFAFVGIPFIILKEQFKYIRNRRQSAEQDYPQ